MAPHSEKKLSPFGKHMNHEKERRPSVISQAPSEMAPVVDLSEGTVLPEGTKLNAAGVPTYAGATGDKLIYLIAATSTAGFSLFGYDQGVMSGLITGPEFIKTFPACDAAVQGQERASLLQATYTSIYELGCLAGALGALFFGTYLGRIRTMQLGAIVMCLGVVIQITAVAGKNAGLQFCIGRVITGIGNGFNTATIPSWQAETAKSHNRGLLVCIEASMIASGTALAYWVDFGMSFVPSSWNWRMPILLQVIFAFFLLLGSFFLPESPRWLLSQGHHVEGRRVCAALSDAPYDSPETSRYTRVIYEAIAQNERMGKTRKRELLTNGPTQHFRRAFIGASSQIMQQIGGCNAIIYFATPIFEQNLGLPRQLSLILGGVNVSVYALAAFGSYYLIEHVGRRKMFLAGSAGQALSMFIVMGCLIPNDPNVTKGAVFGLFLYLCFFGSTWLVVPWLYPAEINPLRTRTYANAISTSSNWLFNFAVVQWTPPMLTAIGWGTFLFFGIINVCFIPFIWFLYPETSKRTLEELDILFAVGYHENTSYVKVAHEMPSLSPEEIAAEAARLGLTGNGELPLDAAATDIESGNNSREGTLYEATAPNGPKKDEEKTA